MSRHRRPASTAARNATRTAWVTAATAALAVGSLTLPSGSASALPVKQPVKQDTWFACSSTTTAKSGNLDAPGATWDLSAPTGSVQGGAGCGQADLMGLNVSVAPSAYLTSFRATGSFTGLLRDLTVRLDNVYVGGGRTGGAQDLTVSLKVNGADRLKEATVRVVPKKSATGASEAFVFSVGDLGLTGDDQETVTHTVVLVVEGAQPLNAWVYDATEVPGGIVFNPATLEPAPVVPNPV